MKRISNTKYERDRYCRIDYCNCFEKIAPKTTIYDAVLKIRTVRGNMGKDGEFWYLSHLISLKESLIHSIDAEISLKEIYVSIDFLESV